MATVSVFCVWCGKAFSAKEADRRRGWARACSKACAAKLREKKLDRFGFQKGLSGTFDSRRKGAGKGGAGGGTDGSTFCDAHLFSNEEHDCNKD